MNLILVRHGETEANTKQILQGHYDSPLTDAGLPAIKETASLLANAPIDAAHVSDLPRTQKTAEYILEHHPHIEPIYNPMLREISFGDWDGQHIDSVDMTSVKQDPYYSRPPSGETILELKSRINRYINFLLQEHPTDTVLVVTHGGVVRNVLSTLNNIPYPDAYDLTPNNAAPHYVVINQPIS